MGIGERQARIAKALQRQYGVEEVLFEEGGEVVVLLEERDGEEVGVEYLLGHEARQYIDGEFPDDEIPDGFKLKLLPMEGGS